MRAVILAGGRGSRLDPYTTIIPKPLMPIVDESILDIILRQLSIHGFKRVTITVGYLSELIRAYLHDKNKYNLEIDFSVEKSPLGTVGPLTLIPDLNKTFLLINGDILTTLNYSKLWSFHQDNKALMTVAICKRSIKIDFGVTKVSRTGDVVDFIEKPELDYLVGMGIAVCEPQILNYIEKGKRRDLPDLIKLLLTRGERVKAYSSRDYWLDIGRKDDHQQAVKDYEEMKEQFFQKP